MDVVVLPPESTATILNHVAGHGDSGSAVIDYNGGIAGFVYRGIEIKTVEIIVDKKTFPYPTFLTSPILDETKKGKTLRTYFFSISGERCVLVESVEMVVERSEAQGDIVSDC